jgi:hypothetical protein
VTTSDLPANIPAQSLIPQIKSAHAKVLEAEDRVSKAKAREGEARSEVLAAAIECGAALNLAEETVKASGAKWLPWLRDNCPSIPKSTAELYKRLAEHEDKIEGCASIRQARRKLTTPRSPPNALGNSTRSPAKDAVATSPASPDLASILANTDADELFAVLKTTYEKHQLEELTDRLEAHLETEAPAEIAA